MNILWPIISVYIVPVFCAYFFSGVYYIVCDVSKIKEDRPDYLSNPILVTQAGVFWLPFLILSIWRIWHNRSRNIFYDYVKRKVVPQIAVFLVLVLDFYYTFKYMIKFGTYAVG
jgi:hypothetical protein